MQWLSQVSFGMGVVRTGFARVMASTARPAKSAQDGPVVPDEELHSSGDVELEIKKWNRIRFCFAILTYIFLAAVFGGFVAWRLRLPLILGFVLGGIVISPFTPGPHLSDLHTFEVFAEVGVVLLMFSIGVRIFDSRPDAREMGCPYRRADRDFADDGHRDRRREARRMECITEGLVIGAAVSVASTMVLARLLTDSGKMPRPTAA